MPIRRRLMAIWVVLVLQAPALGAAKAQDPHLGLTEYELSCMSCHGLDGHGDGPRAKTLKTTPADLTKIAKSNGGAFPAKKVTEVIDGRATVAAHGQREMPVWGDRYRVRITVSERSSMIERRAHAQISALVEYLRTIQEK